MLISVDKHHSQFYRKLVGDVFCEPIQTLVQSSSVCGAASLDKPFAVAHAWQSEFLGEIGDVHSVRKILLVGKHEHGGVSKLLLRQHLLQFVASFGNTIAIVAVHNVNKALGVLEVMSPQRADLVLTSDIPHSELDVLVVNSPVR